MYWAMTPSLRVARSAFFAALAAPFLRRIIHGGFDVAVRFGERLFAIHHARAGHFAELADSCSSNFSHKLNVKLKVESWSRREFIAAAANSCRSQVKHAGELSGVVGSSPAATSTASADSNFCCRSRFLRRPVCGRAWIQIPRCACVMIWPIVAMIMRTERMASSFAAIG